MGVGGTKTTTEQIETSELPFSDVHQRFIIAEIVQIDIIQLTSTTIDSVSNHQIDIVRQAIEGVWKIHVDRLEHGRMLAEVPKQRAHLLYILDYVNRLQLREYQEPYILWKL